MRTRALARRLIGTLSVVVVLGSTGVPPVEAGFLGHSVDADFLSPLSTTVNDPMTTQIVFGGVEFLVFGIFTDITDTDIKFFLNPDGGINFGTSDAFNGWSFADADGTIDPIIGVEIISTTVGLTSNAITFTEDQIFVNFTGLSNSTTFETTLRVTFGTSSAVPEPTTVALLGLGLATLAIVGRRVLARAK